MKDAASFFPHDGVINIGAGVMCPPDMVRVALKAIHEKIFKRLEAAVKV